MRLLRLILPLLVPLIGFAAEPKQPAFIDNGIIRLGVDRESGGAIFYFSRSEPRQNVLNHYDRGRFIQQSYYGESDGSKWVEKDWRWNPVQGGDYRGKPAPVEEFELEENSLYCKSIPVHWASGELMDECRMEQWIHLHDDIAHLRYRFTYSGRKEHSARHQELPAVFVDYAFRNLVRYEGNKPWTGAELRKSVPGWPNESHRIDENWAAFVDEDNYGVGVYVPGTQEITTYRFEGEQGPNGSGCSYFAPIRTMAIKPGKVIDYHVYLTLGSPKQIRTRFAEIAREVN